MFYLRVIGRFLLFVAVLGCFCTLTFCKAILLIVRILNLVRILVTKLSTSGLYWGNCFLRSKKKFLIKPLPEFRAFLGWNDENKSSMDLQSFSHCFVGRVKPPRFIPFRNLVSTWSDVAWCLKAPKFWIFLHLLEIYFTYDVSDIPMKIYLNSIYHMFLKATIIIKKGLIHFENFVLNYDQPLVKRSRIWEQKKCFDSNLGA